MFSIDEFIIAVFCCLDDLLKEVTQGQPIRQKGFAPALSDSEKKAAAAPVMGGVGMM